MSRRSSIVAIGAAASLLGVGVIADRADNKDKADYGAYCTDAQQQRIDDAECRNGHPGSNWYYIPTSGGSNVIPSIGQRASGGSNLVPPTGKNVVSGASPAGDTVSRGGFGSHQSSSVGG